MTHANPKAGRAVNMPLLIMFTALFPLLANLHTQLSSTTYQLLAGVLLGGVAALSHALLYDGYQRWRIHGFARLERTRSLRVLVTTLVYPTLGAMSVVIWLVGSAGDNLGVAYDLGVLIGGSLMGWRAMVALASKRALNL
ncbi:hypothetical protein VDF98_04065 [Xanthomonas campestris pv. raphani]|uniref:hypothetical protein n=1 Tax=Xanthomonas campestris TaxID=339 RepID=UPI00236821A3|nr:hypothetical protein [Xanthomonas campestris]MEA9754677.1 hypothetical protein [Xanthomonas campestris pv. raphani]MEA9763217.1 hypothetical protein [Xanthomonas campestris pv. raphani]MEA9814531.1 hypothetical protein [Xanthomonas campestris pv. raphani]MEA9822290.1 hypothetical protein [Xanthomonas campestris pv. raphani]MEA9850978.1 hypothetical protein [Xanthomonas campestris pv. raphani]